ncbi:hypothetical protein HanPI659440_Chr01g0002081 [Helianthus annuus]|nr:hypothetical protein HanPI659440_Chr01g0002081 [Helianthus annuus]
MVFLVHDCDIQLRRKMKLLRCSVQFDSGFKLVVRVNGRSEREMTSEAFKSPKHDEHQTQVSIFKFRSKSYERKNV